MKDVQPIPGAV